MPATVWCGGVERARDAGLEGTRTAQGILKVPSSRRGRQERTGERPHSLPPTHTGNCHQMTVRCISKSHSNAGDIIPCGSDVRGREQQVQRQQYDDESRLSLTCRARVLALFLNAVWRCANNRPARSSRRSSKLSLFSSPELNG